MAKFMDDAVLDAALNDIKNNCDSMILCAGQPASYAAAVGANALGDQAMAPGDFTLANGDTSGRKVTVSAKAGIPVDTAGTGDHVALVDVGNTRLIAVTTAPSQAVSGGGNFDIAAFDFEIADPT